MRPPRTPRLTDAQAREVGGFPCDHCGRQNTLARGAHPIPDLSAWCMRSGVASPPADLEAASEWYGAPLPDLAPLQDRWDRACGRIPDEPEPEPPLPPEEVRAIQANSAYFF